MMRNFKTTIVTLGLISLMGLFSCASECQMLADKVCEFNGPGSIECLRANLFSKKASSNEQAICKQATKMARELKSGN
tara:strand:- start:2891 stop:3124 length:234 start_codon:yes stop_codon:yes gene_type:complete